MITLQGFIKHCNYPSELNKKWHIKMSYNYRFKNASKDSKKQLGSHYTVKPKKPMLCSFHD